jgi:hypothetical protein
MAGILDVVQGLAQAASHGYDGHGIQTGDPENKVGLRRDEDVSIHDRRLIDGFKVRFSADKMIISYHGEVHMREVHPRQQFENEIEQRFTDIMKFIKKEYRKLKIGAVPGLKEDGEADILMQSLSRHRNWIQAKKSYKITGVEGVDVHGRPSNEKLETSIRSFLDKSTDKRPKNDKAGKNPETPGA